MAEDDLYLPDYDIEATERGLAELERRANSFGAALTGALQQAVVDGRSLDDVLRGLAARMSAIALDAGLAPLENLLSGAASSLTSRLTSGFSSLLPFERGGVPGRTIPFADGGIVGGPTFFPMAGGEIGLMGEAGTEAILPLARGSDGRLGVAGGQGAPQVHVTFNVTSPDAASFRKSEAQVTAMLARAVGRGRRGL